MKRAYSTEIQNVITKVLEEKEWPYQFDEEDGAYRMSVELAGEISSVNMIVRMYEEFFTVKAVSPIKVKNDPDKRREMAEFICRANYGLQFGGFQYDIRDGEILFKAYVGCQGQDIVPSAEMVEHSICIPPLMFDKYSGGMLAVLYGGSSAEDAVAACERPSDEVAEIVKALKSAADGGDDSWVEELLARLAEHLEADDEDDEDDEGNEDEDTSLSSAERGKQTIRLDPFSGEGGNV